MGNLSPATKAAQSLPGSNKHLFTQNHNSQGLWVKTPKKKMQPREPKAYQGSLSRNYTDIHRQQDECDGEKTTSSTPKENPCGVKFTNLLSCKEPRSAL